ncbi:hypothetical protein CKO44_00040 [Rubrivivax gelatinosus]|uniref:Uncharacterized protein n=1 Tax=Rubrivivax gelatinosus TaxID=28068 RepID=A0ABS1DNI1_RUBGE|nr:hypothetical protein [Rubrivivax gelatinosus]MBK1611859.1 hypothetical protein [Rubrivivax gelatinosus]MBK1711516.1 hypothetical protein [Rubrivivax gelatinosus]MBZ8143365.1 hypothetical protein [Rubrivivax gelatinosus]
MEGPKTVREALLADVLGEALELIRRVEALPPLVEDTRSAMLDAAQTLTSTVGSVKTSIEALGATAQRRMAEFMIRSADEARRQVIEEQTRAMVKASKTVVAQELAPALNGVAAQLRSLGREQTANYVLQVALGAVAGIVSSLGTTVLVLRFLVH